MQEEKKEWEKDANIPHMVEINWIASIDFGWIFSVEKSKRITI